MLINHTECTWISDFQREGWEKCGTILSHQSLLLSFDQIARSLRITHRHTTAPIMRNINIFLCLSRNRWILFALKRRFLRRICKYKGHATWLQHSIFFVAHLPKLRPCSYYKCDLQKAIYHVRVNATRSGLCEIGF